jgi:hypothetical protein
MRKRIIATAVAAFLGGLSAPAAEPADVMSALATIKAVGREGAGNDAAGSAWKRLVAQSGDALFPTLDAFDGASPTAANWLRAAVDAIAEAEHKAGRKLPADKLEGYVNDSKHPPVARRIAFELLTAEAPSKKAELLPRLIDDPSLELRRDAIAAEIERLKAVTAGSTLTAEYTRLLKSARDPDQVEQLARLLESLGVKTDLAARLGFVTRWHVAGPFDNTEGTALTTSFLPESEVDLAATYEGKGGEKFGWKALGTGDPHGMFDLNRRLAKHMNAAAYAYAVIESDKGLPVDVRAGTQNAVRIFLNGTLLFQREEYHHGTSMDQHIGKGVLKAGRNEILVKVAQNNQKEDWAQVWGFQLRVCDALGGPVAVKVVSPTAEQAPAPPPEPKKKESK